MSLSGYRKWYLVYFSIIIGLLFFRTTMAECPPPELIKPCNCENIPFTLVECGGIRDMETLVRVFEKTADRKFHSFALYNSSLLYLPASSISTKRFEQILLVNLSMVGMFDQPPDPSNNISMITIMSSKISRIRWENFKNLKKLKIISIYDTDLKTLEKSFVDNVSGSVQRLHLYNSQVRKLQYNAFSHMTDLYDLQIQHAGIKFLRRSLFPTPSKIITFNFANNRIDALPDDLFTDMPRINYIDLSGNQISEISESVFGRIYNVLEVLHMEENPVVCDCSLRWYMSRYRGTLKGNCGGPEDRKGKSFHHLTPKDFSYCT